MTEPRQLLDLPVIDPDMLPQSSEQAIVAAGANVAPRVTPDHIAGLIVSEHYFTAEQGAFAAFEPLRGGDVVPPALSLLTFCVLVLRNGTKLVGINYGAIDPSQHRAEQGRVEARKEAVEQIWQLEGYLLRQRLHEGFKS